MLSLSTWPKWPSQARQGVMNVLKSVNVQSAHFALGKNRIFFKSIETVSNTVKFCTLSVLYA